MQAYDIQLFKNADLSQPTLTSEQVDLDCFLFFSLQAVFTGNAIGNLEIQASNDYIDPINSGLGQQVVNWTTVSTVPLGAPGSIMVNYSDVSYSWMRVVYTKSSGSGSLMVNLHTKTMS